MIKLKEKSVAKEDPDVPFLRYDTPQKNHPCSCGPVKVEFLEQTIVSVRWFDGYLESFDCDEVRFGSDLLWMRLLSGGNRHIPLRMVRWRSCTPESHEK